MTDRFMKKCLVFYASHYEKQVLKWLKAKEDQTLAEMRGWASHQGTLVQCNNVLTTNELFFRKLSLKAWRGLWNQILHTNVQILVIVLNMSKKSFGKPLQ